MFESDACATDFTLDVDHHARACWWSTSESSEKCPRVMRGNMSVPSEFAFSSDLIGICAEFVTSLMQLVICPEIEFKDSSFAQPSCVARPARDAMPNLNDAWTRTFSCRAMT
jgi:hypothetical protein